MILETAKFDSNIVIGWCYESDGENAPAVLELRVDGTTITTITADKPFNAVYPDSTSNKPVGFSAKLPAFLRDGQPHRVELLEAGGRARLSKIIEGPDSRVSIGDQIYGEYHGYERGLVRGWLCRRGETLKPVLTVDGQEVECEIYLDPTHPQRGQHGFQAAIPQNSTMTLIMK
ncbi:hypothetical protein [Nesterenkonia pannonica]|uniref:hypothetical protein n=1 Tax=Nesterenkonia pannonica TaxID=1548602 RepID=UPI0021640B9E|nr:hypothetical protein [Nesterenkonia pannonica]